MAEKIDISKPVSVPDIQLSTLLHAVQLGRLHNITPATLNDASLDERLALIDAVLDTLEPVREALRLAYIQVERKTDHYESRKEAAPKTLKDPVGLLAVMAKRGYDSHKLADAGAMKPDLAKCLQLLTVSLLPETPALPDEKIEAQSARAAEAALKMADGLYSGGKPIIKLYSK